MPIEIVTETVTVTKYRLELTEAEVGEILADPTAFQRQLRALRGESKRGRHGARNLALGKRGKADPKGSAGLTCPHCGKTGLSKMGLGVHIGFKHKDLKGQPAPAAAS